MHMFAVGLLFSTALSAVSLEGPSEDAMRRAFATDLSDGVNSVMAYVAETGGEDALERIRNAHTDEYEIRGFRKLDCRADGSGHVCDFSVAIDTVAGRIEQSVTGRFFIGACGLTYDHDA